MKPVKKVKKEEVKIDPKVISRLKNYLGIIIAVFAIALYVQSLKFNYTLDDNTVIKANKVTTKGIKGIPTLLKTDYWYGYDIEVRGPIYRPLSMVMFAIEWQFFPDKPLVGHLMNVILYALSCWLLFILLFELFGRRNLLLPFICALLYVAHPIHTEVVASIKSRDEILCFLFGILFIYTIIKYIEKSSIVLLIVSAICFFLALLSKENSITFLAIMPLVLYFFTNANIKKIAIATCAFIGMAVVFFMIRAYVFSTLHPLSYDSPLNNSILAAPDWIGQKATAIFILFRYVLMMIYPASLSYDYSYAYIPIQKISDPLAMFSILFYLGLLIYAILNIRKKSILAFEILFFMLII
ncbi:MAG: glycosyltransferase family 39 protein [Bacteroidota bacterium]